MRWGFAQVAQQLYTTADKFAEKDRMFAMVTELRPQLFRMGIPWSYVAKVKDPLATNARDWSMVDTSIGDALLLGADIVMQVGLYRPSWGSWWFGLGGTPATVAEYADFTTECVNRYKPGGVGIRTDGKYAANSGRGVSIWECWNEQNNSTFWNRTVSAVDYVAHLVAFNAAVKAIQPGGASTVLFGGTQHIQRVQGPYPGENTSVMPEVTFVKGCYAEGAHGHFDAMNVHYYQNDDTVVFNGATLGPAPSTGTDNWRQLTEIRQLMIDNGDTALKMWVTEIGWSTNQVTQAQQSTYMQTLYSMMLGLGYVDAFIIYNVRDDGNTTALQDAWGAMDYSFNKKLIWQWLKTLSSPVPPPMSGTASFPVAGLVLSQTNVSLTPNAMTAAASFPAPGAPSVSFSVAIPGSGTTIPSSFDTFGDGLSLASGTLSENAHGDNAAGNWYSGYIHNVACNTFLHHSKIQFSNANAGTTDRGCGAIVGCDDYATPLNYVEAVGVGVHYMGLNLAIRQVVAGVHSSNLAWTNVTFVNGDFLDFVITKPGANYVYSVYKNGSGTASLTWTDTTGNPPPGKYVGGECMRINAAGVQYGSPGIKGTWTGGDN
jgi:hypothetical protein